MSWKNDSSAQTEIDRKHFPFSRLLSTEARQIFPRTVGRVRSDELYPSGNQMLEKQNTLSDRRHRGRQMGPGSKGKSWHRKPAVAGIATGDSLLAHARSPSTDFELNRRTLRSSSRSKGPCCGMRNWRVGGGPSCMNSHRTSLAQKCLVENLLTMAVDHHQREPDPDLLRAAHSSDHTGFLTWQLRVDRKCLICHSILLLACPHEGSGRHLYTHVKT